MINKETAKRGSKIKDKSFTLDRTVIVEKLLSKVKIPPLSSSSRQISIWWYQDNPFVQECTFVVKSCNSREELKGLTGLGRINISELYIIIKKISPDGTIDEDSDDVGVAVLKKHCKSVKFY